MAKVKFRDIDEDLIPLDLLRRMDISQLHHTLPTSYPQGSYAGARAAHMRVLYPDLVFGAIASSGLCVLCSCYTTHY